MPHDLPPYTRGVLDAMRAIHRMRRELPPGFTGTVTDLDPAGGRVRAIVWVDPPGDSAHGLAAMLEALDEAPTMQTGLSADGAVMRWASPDGVYLMAATRADLRACGLLVAA